MTIAIQKGEILTLARSLEARHSRPYAPIRQVEWGQVVRGECLRPDGSGFPPPVSRDGPTVATWSGGGGH